MTTATTSQPSRTRSALPLLLEFCQQQNWLMHEPVLRQMIAIVDRHFQGVRLTDDELQAALVGAGPTAKPRRMPHPRDLQQDMEMVDGAAVIHVDGVVAKYSRLVNNVSQPRGTSVEALSRLLAEAVADKQCKSICLRIESPGGTSDGLPEFANQVYEASRQKPVIAVADGLAASAAYWIGSQACRFYANPSAMVGSIGVYTTLIDSSRAAEDQGFKVILVSTGRNKGTGAPGVAISAEQIKPVQRVVDEIFSDFLGAVHQARAGRGLTMDALTALADGRIYSARDALAGNLIDGICTMSAALAAPCPALRQRATMVAVPSARKPPAPPGPAPVAAAPRAAASLRTPDDRAGVEALEMIRSFPKAAAPVLQPPSATSRRRSALPTDLGCFVAVPDDGKPATYERALSTLHAAGATRVEALRGAALAFPISHRAWCRAGQLVKGRQAASRR